MGQCPSSFRRRRQAIQDIGGVELVTRPATNGAAAMPQPATWNVKLETEPFIEAVPSEPPMKYGDHSFSAAVLRAYSEAKDHPDLRNINDWENVLIVDESFRNNLKIQAGIKMTTWFIMALLQAYGALAFLAFTVYQNPDSASFNSDEDEAAQFLNELYTKSSCRSIEEAMDRWDLPYLIKDQPVDGHSGSLGTEIARIMKDQSIGRESKHGHILALIRIMRQKFNVRWNCNGITFESFSNIFNDAKVYAGSQPLLLNNVGFSIVQAIQQQLKDYTKRATDATSSINKKRSIFIIGGRIDPSQAKSIRTMIEKIEGGGAESRVTVVHVMEGDKDESSHLHQSIDDAKKGDRDWYEYIPINVNMLFSHGPSAALILKVLESQGSNTGVVQARKPSSSMYGVCQVFRSKGGEVQLPQVAHIRNHLGLDS